MPPPITQPADDTAWDVGRRRTTNLAHYAGEKDSSAKPLAAEGGARTAMLERHPAWPRDIRFIPSDRLASLHPFPRDARIQFFEEDHYYLVDGKRVEFSVTSVAHAMFPEFDTRAVIANMSEQSRSKPAYAGLSDIEIALKWRANGADASDRGTAMHAAVETAFNTGCWSTDPALQKEMRLARDFYNKEIRAKGITIWRTEPIVFREEPLLAGSVDCLVRLANGRYGIMDWKRSREIAMGKHGRNGFGAPPFQHLENVNFVIYSIQLTLYAFLFRDDYGLDVDMDELYIVVFHPNQETYLKIKAMDVRRETQWLLTNYDAVRENMRKNHAVKDGTAAWIREATRGK